MGQKGTDFRGAAVWGDEDPEAIPGTGSDLGCEGVDKVKRIPLGSPTSSQGAMRPTTSFR